MAKQEPYPSDLTEKEWQVLTKLIPRPQRRRRPPQYRKRDILNAIFYLVRSGCALLPRVAAGLPLLRPLATGGSVIQAYLREQVRIRHGKKKPRALRFSTARVLRQLPSPECEALMRAKRLWDENDISWWMPLA
jgi:hypothetical protein